MRKILGIITIVGLLFSVPVAAMAASEGYAAGTDAGQTFSNQLNSGSKVNSLLSEPLTSSSTKMTTFGEDGETISFDAQLTEASTNAFLEVFAQPAGSGDITTLIIKQDTDFDGETDYVLQPSIPISGLCANGVISCNQGTWSDCKYYAWTTADNLKVKMNPLPSIEGLGGCFCINKSCGSNLVWSNMQYVLSTLGIGVVSALQTTDPRVVITGAETTVTYIQYYGQRTTDIGAAQSSSGVYFSGTADPTEVYAAGDFTGDDEVAAQVSDSDSYYSQIVGSYSSRINPTEANACVIQRTVDFDDSGTPYISTVETCSGVDLTLCNLDEEKICDYYGNNCVKSYQNGSGTGLIPVSNGVSLETPEGAIWGFDTNGSIISYIREDITPNESGVVATGSSMWWYVKREYLCDTGIVYDTASGNARSGSVAESADMIGNQLVYEDYGVVYSVDLPFGESELPACEKACKVTKTITKTDVGADGGTWEQVKDVTSTETTYKTCVEDECPLEDGEKLAVDCVCMNNFAEATALLQTLQSAGSDMICSSD